LGKRLLVFCIILLAIACAPERASAQMVTVSGVVYDLSGRRPIEAVGVISTSGRGTLTDSMGRYSINVSLKDSIYFTLIGKATMKYPVDTINNLSSFNVMIHVRALELPEVKVRNNYYKYDSVQNRKDYAKVFDFKKPTIRLSNAPSYNPGGLTVGFDLDEIINMFRTKRNRSILALQNRLLQQEQEKYVNNRYSKAFVRKITKLQSPELDTFMVRYRPEYEVVRLLNDLELGYYIQQSFEQYKAARTGGRGALLRRREE
jgi:hypothetical protein